MDKVYANYLNLNIGEPSINGRIFEYIICETLAYENITPFYYQAKFLHVPNCDFDVALYHPGKTVVLTLKVSLRERYKQADLEGIALRQVYRGANSYLITLNEKEALTNKPKIATGDINGLNDIVLANKSEYTDLLLRISKIKYESAIEIMPISGNIYPE